MIVWQTCVRFAPKVAAAFLMATLIAIAAMTVEVAALMPVSPIAPAVPYSGVIGAAAFVGSSQRRAGKNDLVKLWSSSSTPPPKHDVGAANPMDDMDPEQLARAQAYMEHQQNSPKIGYPTDVRSLVQYNHGFAVMSTISKSNPGFPGGSVVGFAPDDEGRPLFVFSGMSSHTQDLLVDPKCSVTIAAKEFKGAADGRVNLMGVCQRIKDKDEVAKAKEIYLKKHPGAFWVDFGDFFWYRLEVKAIRFVGGFARAGTVTPEEYKDAEPDPIMAFGGHVAQHMNEDHMDSTIAMVEHYVPGLKAEGYVKEAIITSVDSLGMFVKVSRDPENNAQLPGQPQQFKLRLPFPRKVTERKDVKTVIVEMTQESSAAATDN